MDETEAACYANRYTDLNGMDPNEHYARIGQKQGRNIRCVYFFTLFQSERYLKRYTALGNEMGRSNKEAWRAGKDHWYNNGSKQVPPLDISVTYQIEKPYKCADYNGECKCPGRVHFGLKKRLDNGEDITTLEQMADWKKSERLEGKMTKVDCNKHAMKKKGKTIWKDQEKDDLQCFCEPHVKPDPFHCAGEGEVCKCPKGSVFYGAKFVPGTSKLNNFEQMQESEYAVARAGRNGEVTCQASSFVGGSLLPGFEKDCYCDDQGIVDPEVVKEDIMYWEGVLEEQEAAAAEARAEAEAEAARAAAAAETAALKAELEAEKAKVKAAQERFAKAQEEAKAKAEEQAAKDKAEAAAAAAAEAAREKELAAQAAQREQEHKAALKAAEEAAKAAAASVHAEERRKLLEEAEKAKEEAIKAEVASSLASQKEEHDRLMAEQAAKHEADLKAQAAAAAEAKRLEDAEEARLEAIEEAKRKEMMEAMKKAHADELASQAEAQKAAAQKRMAEALAKQQEAFEAKMAAEAAERARIKKEEEEEEARQLAAKKAEEAAAEAAKKKAEEEEKERKAAELAAHRQLIEDEKAAAAEEARLAKEAHEEEMAKAKAKAEAEKAKHDLELAKTKADQQRALAAQQAAEEAQRLAEEAEAAALAKKENLENDIKHKQLIAELAEQAVKEAQEKKAKAQAKAEEWKKLAAEQEAKSKAEIAAAEAATKARKEELEAERARAKAKHDAALKAQAETYRLASLAAEQAHEAAEEARRTREAEQIAEHKRRMAARRSAFEKAFRHVWAAGTTGVSMIQMSVPNHVPELTAKLFRKTLVADVTDYVENVKKSWKHHGRITWEDQRHKLTMLTSDDRIAEAIEEVAGFMAGFHE